MLDQADHVLGWECLGVETLLGLFEHRSGFVPASRESQQSGPAGAESDDVPEIRALGQQPFCPPEDCVDLVDRTAVDEQVGQ